MIFSTVHKLFQELKSIAVGIQPINGIKKSNAFLLELILLKRVVSLFIGPLKRHKVKAIKVEVNKTIPITLISWSNNLNFPIINNKLHIVNIKIVDSIFPNPKS